MESLPPRVVLTGSESTGKTTLAAELARHYGVPWVPEFVRGYAERKGAPLTAADVEPIARGQIAEQDRLLRGTAGPVHLLDTDLLSTVLYAEHYYGECPEWIRAAAHERRGSLYLLCDIDVAWEADPVRDRGGLREEMQALFRAGLEARGLRYITVRGSVADRMGEARKAVTALLISLHGRDSGPFTE